MIGRAARLAAKRASGAIHCLKSDADTDVVFRDGRSIDTSYARYNALKADSIGRAAETSCALSILNKVHGNSFHISDEDCEKLQYIFSNNAPLHFSPGAENVDAAKANWKFVCTVFGFKNVTPSIVAKIKKRDLFKDERQWKPVKKNTSNEKEALSSVPN